MRVTLKLHTLTLSPSKLAGAFFSHGLSLKEAREQAQNLIAQDLELELSGTLVEINNTFNPLGIKAEAAPTAYPATGTEG